MQPKSQFSSGTIAHKASAPQILSSSVCRALQLRKASAPTEPQQLSLKSSTTILRPCSPRASLAQAFSPRNLSSSVLKSPTAQLRRSIQAIRFMQNRAKSISRGESGEIKNEYSLRKRLHMSWVPSPKKKKKTTARKQRYVREIRH